MYYIKHVFKGFMQKHENKSQVLLETEWSFSFMGTKGFQCFCSNLPIRWIKTKGTAAVLSIKPVGRSC